jgi:O-phospho-L-seryl-tRNASec:L-selenocysteinyl-tRNA synthase
MVNWLLTHKRIPEDPWPSNLIEHLLYEISLMDSNNYINTAGVGEREGRVFSEIVSKRHFHMSHGIGRSGDLFSVQPKAAGSSLVSKLTCSMSKHALQVLGIGKVPCLVLPLATGMSLTLCLLTLRQVRPVIEN